MPSDDINLQKAIFASIQTSNSRGGSSSGAGARNTSAPSIAPSGFRNVAPAGRPTSEAPRGGVHRGGGGGGGNWSGGGIYPQPAGGSRSAGSTPSVNKGGAGRRNRLEREGIVAHAKVSESFKPPVHPGAPDSPGKTTQVRRAHCVPNSRSVSSQGASSSASTDIYSPSVGRGTRSIRGGSNNTHPTAVHTLGAGKRQVGPWVQRGGSGVFALSPDFMGGNLGGDANPSCKPTVLTYEPQDGSANSVRGGSYSFKFSFKCEHAPPASGLTSGFDLLLEVKSVDGWSDGVSIRVDAVDRVWTLVRREKEQASVMTSKEDRDLRPGVWHALTLEVRSGNTMTVFCDKRTIFQSLRVPQSGPTGLVGPLGLGVSAAKLQWKDWVIEGATGDYGLKHVQAPYTGDDRVYVQMIEQDILDRDLGVGFEDIASLDDAKALLNEAVTLPLIIPEFFTGIREPWKGVLLFGPPGTGKTLLAKAVSASTGVKFFNCSVSTLMSKWRGESEKLVKVLFNMARHYAPSIIFFDEADALLSVRGGDGEHEASRRFKSELLSQMDGIPSASGDCSSLVMVLATSNCPWDLDEALRRRLEKRIYIPLPDDASRRAMFQIHLSKVNVSPEVDFEALVAATSGYSGADIKIICRDAAMMPMRRLLAEKRSPDEIRALKEEGSLDVSLVQEDFMSSIRKTQPSVSHGDVRKYEDWNTTFASV